MVGTEPDNAWEAAHRRGVLLSDEILDAGIIVPEFAAA